MKLERQGLGDGFNGDCECLSELLVSHPERILQNPPSRIRFKPCPTRLSGRQTTSIESTVSGLSFWRSCNALSEWMLNSSAPQNKMRRPSWRDVDKEKYLWVLIVHVAWPVMSLDPTRFKIDVRIALTG